MKMQRIVVHSRRSDSSGERGVSVLELLLVAAMIGVVTIFALLRISAAQQAMRLTNSIHEFQSYLEKARVDSVRRHAMTSAQMSSVRITDSTTYVAAIDFDGNGSPEERTIRTGDGASFNTGTATLPLTISFDWRGRVAIKDGAGHPAAASFTMEGRGADDSKTINVSGFGDVGTSNLNVARPNISNVSASSGIRSNLNVSAIP